MENLLFLQVPDMRFRQLCSEEFIQFGSIYPVNPIRIFRPEQNSGRKTRNIMRSSQPKGDNNRSIILLI